jgi:hypothetical protein
MGISGKWCFHCYIGNNKGLLATLCHVVYATLGVRLFRPIRIVMVSQNLADLIHELQFRIWFELGLIFHDIKHYRQNMEKSRTIFPCLIPQYKFRWKIFHLSTLLGLQITEHYWKVVTIRDYIFEELVKLNGEI